MAIDQRLQQLSYSSLLTLHSCPRKYQLSKMECSPEQEEDHSSSVTFAFGHVVGLGIQNALEGKTEDVILWESFLMWEPDLYADNTRQAKSFWQAVLAVQKFMHLCSECSYLEDWELVYIDGKPAVELSFIVTTPTGFKYRGFVDAVLKHKHTGEILVLECKTTSTKVNAATYKNSAQAIGYSIVLDHLFPSLSSYKVLYLIYKTKDMEFEQMEFHKSYLQRALWIQEMLLDIACIEMYEEVGVFPMRGESCYDFYRECEYLNICTLATSSLTTPLTDEGVARIATDNENKYQIKLTLQDLIQSQLAKE